MQRFIHNIINSKFKKFMVIMITLASLGGSIMMLPSKLVLARMLPGKSANTFSIYVDTPNGSSIEQTKEVTSCVVDILKQENEVTIAGKTGTAQVVGIPQSEKKRMKEHELEYYKRSHAWLTTYAPYKKPQYVVTVLIEHGGHGGSAAGEIVSKIYDKLFELGYIKK